MATKNKENKVSEEEWEIPAFLAKTKFFNTEEKKKETPKPDWLEDLVGGLIGIVFFIIFSLIGGVILLAIVKWAFTMVF